MPHEARFVPRCTALPLCPLRVRPETARSHRPYLAHFKCACKSSPRPIARQNQVSAVAVRILTPKTTENTLDYSFLCFSGGPTHARARHLRAIASATSCPAPGRIRRELYRCTSDRYKECFEISLRGSGDETHAAVRYVLDQLCAKGCLAPLLCPNFPPPHYSTACNTEEFSSVTCREDNCSENPSNARTSAMESVLLLKWLAAFCVLDNVLGAATLPSSPPPKFDADAVPDPSCNTVFSTRSRHSRP